jgi:ABC-type sugar transport system permease subunit
MRNDDKYWLIWFSLLFGFMFMLSAMAITTYTSIVDYNFTKEKEDRFIKEGYVWKQVTSTKSQTEMQWVKEK